MEYLFGSKRFSEGSGKPANLVFDLPGQPSGLGGVPFEYEDYVTGLNAELVVRASDKLKQCAVLSGSSRHRRCCGSGRRRRRWLRF